MQECHTTRSGLGGYGLPMMRKHVKILLDYASEKAVVMGRRRQRYVTEAGHYHFG